MNTQKKGATRQRVNAQWTPDPHRYFNTTLEDVVNGLIRVVAWTGGLVSLALAGGGVDGTGTASQVAGLGLIGLVLCLVGAVAGRMEGRS